MSVIEEISRMSKVGCGDKELLDYIYENYDEIEYELNGNEYKEPKEEPKEEYKEPKIMIFALTATWK